MNKLSVLNLIIEWFSCYTDELFDVEISDDFRKFVIISENGKC